MNRVKPGGNQIRAWPVFLMILCAGLIVTVDSHCKHLGSYEQQLEYSDVVVRGIVEAIETEHVPEITYWPFTRHPERPLPTTTVRLAVTEILRGQLDLGSVDVVAPGGFPPGVPSAGNVIHSMYGFTFDFEVGREVIYCLWFVPEGGGVFLAPPDEGRFRKTDAGWLNVAQSKRPLTLDEIRATVSLAEPGYLLKEADLVVDGVVVKVDSITTSRWAPVKERVEMEIKKTWKGSPSGQFIRFEYLSRGGPSMAPVPQLERGDRYIVFLQSRDGVLTPFAGVNGMLQVRGRQLIRNNAVQYEMSRERLDKVFMNEIQHGK